MFHEIVCNTYRLRATDDHGKTKIIHYRSQQKLRKGNVFTSVCQEFCPWGRGGGCLPLGLEGCTPPRETPLQTDTLGQTPPHADTPLDRHPTLADTPWADTPRQTPAPPPETATAADGMHPTGMHSCEI